MADIYGYTGEFERSKVLQKIDDLDCQLREEQAKEPDKRNANREFELMYARFMAGLKLNTGARFF